jgi:hypothetical protein
MVQIKFPSSTYVKDTLKVVSLETKPQPLEAMPVSGKEKSIMVT